MNRKVSLNLFYSQNIMNDSRSLKHKYNLVVVLGPTATGKTHFAAALANRLDGEIISADSRQIYRRMNIGTGKDYADYYIANKNMPVHLIDIHEPGYRYNVFEYQTDFFRVYKEILLKHKLPILCGGTGLYIEAVTRKYRLISVPVNEDLRAELKDKSLSELENILASYKKLHNKTDTDTIKRAIRAIEIEEYYRTNPVTKTDLPDIRPIYLGLAFDREERRRRISERLHQRLKEGMIDEVKSLLNDGLSPADLVYYGLEYKFITLYLTGKLDYDTMAEKLNVAIHQFAKRQMTWFRKMEREGIQILWIDSEFTMEEKIDIALDMFRKNMF